MARIYRFGGPTLEFRLDPATRELRQGDTAVAVPPRAFDCIVYLLEQRERAVGRDELIAAVWGKTDISDGMLGQTVLSARRALEDTGKEQLFIRTVFRFGYHWVAAVETIDEASGSVIASGAPSEAVRIESNGVSVDMAKPPSQRPHRWPLLLGGTAILLVACALLAPAALRWLHRDETDPPAASATQAAIALVLPVTVEAGSGHDWIRLGLMDLVAARLRTAGLAVVPSDDVVALTRRSPNGEANQAELAHATGATLIIDAQAEAIGARWRLSLRTLRGREPGLTGIGESNDVLAAARGAADDLARQLGYAPTPDRDAEGEPPALASLLAQIEAAILTDHLDAARTLIASATPGQRDQPELRLRLAQIDYQAGDLAAAATGFAAVAATVSAEQDAVLHARALTNLGVVAAVQGDTAKAGKDLDDAITLLRAQRAPDALGKALNARGNVAAAENRFDAALQDYAEARAAFESAGSPLALAVLDSNLGALDMHRLRYADAAPVFERAAQRFAIFGVHAAELNALTALAEIKLALLDTSATLALEPRLRELVAQVADPARQRYGDLTRAQVLAANGRLQSATGIVQRVLDAAGAASDRIALSRGHALAAEIALARGDTRQAAEQAEAALQRYDASDDARERARTFAIRIDALLAGGAKTAAATATAELSRFAAREENAAARLYTDLAAAESGAADTADTDRNYARALAEADALRIPLDLREAVRAYAEWLVARGELARASAVAERVSGWTANDYASALLQLRVHHALGDTNLWRSALTRTQALAGERTIAAALLAAPDRGALPAAPH
jgi:DNA-binding winged helix-turn-helix (wHTH) protein/tetratricopeptide (TPR) repeat protein